MEQSVVLLRSLCERVKDGTTNVVPFKIKPVDKRTQFISGLLACLALACLVFIFVLILSVAVSLWLGELLGKSYYGFFIVDGFYLTGGLFLYFFFFRHLKNYIRNFMMQQIPG